MAERVREQAGAVAEAVRAMYAAYPDSSRFDEHLHEQITIWESDQPGPPIGLAELNALRDRRAVDRADRGDGGAGGHPVLSVEDVLVDRWGADVAVARYLLRAASGDGAVTFRVTDVWDGSGPAWQIVHHHAEQLPGAESPDDGPADA